MNVSMALTIVTLTQLAPILSGASLVPVTKDTLVMGLLVKVIIFCA